MKHKYSLYTITKWCYLKLKNYTLKEMVNHTIQFKNPIKELLNVTPKETWIKMNQA